MLAINKFVIVGTMIILLHSSKTMRSSTILARHVNTSEPALLNNAQELMSYLKTLEKSEIIKIMHVSEKLAEKVITQNKNWNSYSPGILPAIDSFIGDIYSGLRADSLNSSDRLYAQDHLRIISGLYGILRPLDGISPYRLEMAYKFPSKKFASLYIYWADIIAKQIPSDEVIINTSSVEYTKALLPYMKNPTVITPKFYTINPKTNEPTFVTVHSKISRGAFARWMIKNRINNVNDLTKFDDLGYRYEKNLSENNHPAFVCKQFGGIGLSMRLT
jgi:uncharacterized protein